ncbi:glycogen debranching protein GlgX [Amphibiibacter pelophylacis]|uniref:Glycogen debranching protein GlgX n=1 Tax=Amphibiibacter pelophylacis TaxID=1799477 RepID=A0ACC6NYW0_9BURK
MTDISPRQLLPGQPHPLGACLAADGVNFAVIAPSATRVELCLFDAQGHETRHDLPVCTAGVWHGFVPAAQGGVAGAVYGFRAHGRWAPREGLRYNAAKLLLDPCAMEVVGQYDGSDIHGGHVPNGTPAPDQKPDGRDNAATALKARVVAPLPEVPQGARPRIAPHERVIYEAHVKALTALHPDVPPAQRGRYAALGHPAVMAHLKRLGVTTVSLMPVACRADEPRLLAMGLVNHWSYNPVAFSAPEPRYASTPQAARQELRAAIDALHAAGFEVILDVVYNHTAESDEFGPTFHLRGLDNALFYPLRAGDRARYENWTGCGHGLNLSQPLVQRLVMDSLRLWVTQYGVDGFRFDLAPVLARGAMDGAHGLMQGAPGEFSGHAPLLAAIAQDPQLQGALMIAEPWDIGPGGYQLGAFPSGWLEWNDRFRDVMRAFWLHGATSAGLWACRLAGSSDVFGARSASSSVNFITAHDGFTLRDLVSYSQRHNEANGEHNRDGHGDNLSVNNGTEGPSDDPAVNAARARQQRVLLATLLLGLGTPMLLSGDEIGHSQRGNNNAYCQDNATTWLDWAHADTGLLEHIAALLALRRRLPALHSPRWWLAADAALPAPHEAAGAVIARWLRPDGQPLQGDAWDSARALMLHLLPLDGSPQVLLALNAGDQAVELARPDGVTWTEPLALAQNASESHLPPQSLRLFVSSPDSISPPLSQPATPPDRA